MTDPLLRRLLPDVLACAELLGDPDCPPGYPEEEAAIAHAVESRRRDHRTVRHCARIALAELGVAPVAILSGPRREPLWPPGVVGSLTHCAGYRAAAVGLRHRVRAVGIDAEPHAPLPPDVLGIVALPEERRWLAEVVATNGDTHWDRLLFCAKEAVYKAWYPLTGCWLGFEDVSIRFDPPARRFTAGLRRTGPLIDGTPLTSFEGRWLVTDGLALAAVVVPALRP